MAHKINVSYVLPDAGEFRKRKALYKESIGIENIDNGLVLRSCESKSSNKKIVLGFECPNDYTYAQAYLERLLMKSGVVVYELAIENELGNIVYRNITEPRIIEPKPFELLYFTPVSNGPGWLIIYREDRDKGLKGELLDYRDFGVPNESELKNIVDNSWPGLDYLRFGFFVPGWNLNSSFFIATGIIAELSKFKCPTSYHVVPNIQDEGNRPEFTEDSKRKIAALDKKLRLKNLS